MRLINVRARHCPVAPLLLGEALHSIICKRSPGRKPRHSSFTMITSSVCCAVSPFFSSIGTGNRVETMIAVFARCRDKAVGRANAFIQLRSKAGKNPLEINSDLGICQSKSRGSHIDRKCEEPQSISGRVFGVRALEEGDLPATNDLQKGAEGNAGGNGAMASAFWAQSVGRKAIKSACDTQADCMTTRLRSIG